MSSPQEVSATIPAGDSITGDLKPSFNAYPGEQGVGAAVITPAAWTGTVKYLQWMVPVVPSPASSSDYEDLADDEGTLVRFTIDGAVTKPFSMRSIVELLGFSMLRLAARDASNVAVVQAADRSLTVKFRGI